MNEGTAALQMPFLQTWRRTKAMINIWHSSRKMFVPIDATNSSPSFHRSPPRILMLGLWALSVLGLLAVLSMVFSRHRQERLRFKSNRLGSQMPMEDLTKAITKAMTSISLTLNHTLTLEISLFILRIPSGRGTLGTFPPNLLYTDI